MERRIEEGMDAVVITGASRGIGAAIVTEYLSREVSPRLFCVARSSNPELSAAAVRRGARLEWFEQDLADALGTKALAASTFDHLASEIRKGQLNRIVLVNNAAMIEPLGLTAHFDHQRAAVALQVNLLSVMSFTSQMLALAARLPCEYRILNVSSGAGRMPIEGWSVYCSSKAALDMYTRCVKIEQSGLPNPVKICSLAPGVVDTGMQAQIRDTSTDRLPDVARFQDLKSSGALVSPAEVAERMIAYLQRPDFGEREVDDIRNY